MNDMTALSTTGNDRIVPGGNNPPVEPTPFELVSREISDLYEEAKNWADGEPIATQAIHDEIERLRDALNDAGNRAEALRVAEKKPLDDQIDAIQARFNPLVQPKKGKVALGKDALGTLLAGWRTKVANEKAAAAERARREAEEERQKAEAAIRSSAGNLEAREKAEEQLSLAKEADKYARKQERGATTGLGLRTRPVATLTDLNAAIRHYWGSHRAEFEALVCDLAAKDARAGKREIPGFTVTEERTAI